MRPSRRRLQGLLACHPGAIFALGSWVFGVGSAGCTCESRGSAPAAQEEPASEGARAAYAPRVRGAELLVPVGASGASGVVGAGGAPASTIKRQVEFDPSRLRIGTAQRVRLLEQLRLQKDTLGGAEPTGSGRP
jgi:hypothetical protein